MPVQGDVPGHALGQALLRGLTGAGTGGSAPFALVLGVAQDGGHPHAGCAGPCCGPAWEDPSLSHRVACVGLVDPGSGRGWLLDATPNLPTQANDLAEAGGRLAGVLLTHGHFGHVAGLGWLGAEAMAADRMPVWAPQGLAAALADGPYWGALTAGGHVAVRPVAPGDAVELGPLACEAVAVEHRGGDTVAWIVRGPTGSLLYCPDADSWDGLATPLDDLVAGVDCALVDGTFSSPSELGGRSQGEVAHPTVEETMARISGWPRAERAKVRFIHLNHTNPLLDPASSEAAAVAAAGAGVASEGSRFPL